MDWDAIAGILAAVAAIILHFFHVVDISILLSVTVVLIALLFLRDLRRDNNFERMEETLRQTQETVKSIQTNIVPSDVVLVGPQKLRGATKDFSTRAQGEMVWFHICPLMFKRQELFDTLLLPAIENQQVHSIQFVMDSRQKELWDKELAPKIAACRDKEKVKEPCWTTIEESYPQLASRHTLTFKNCFGAVAGYVDGRIFCSCGVFGFALKLPEADRDEIFSADGKSLKYFAKGHVKKEYAVIPSPLFADKNLMRSLIKKSIKYSCLG